MDTSEGSLYPACFKAIDAPIAMISLPAKNAVGSWPPSLSHCAMSRVAPSIVGSTITCSAHERSASDSAVSRPENRSFMLLNGRTESINPMRLCPFEMSSLPAWYPASQLSILTEEKDSNRKSLSRSSTGLEDFLYGARSSASISVASRRMGISVSAEMSSPAFTRLISRS